MSHDAISTPEATTTTAPWFEATCDSYEPYISNALRLATPELYRSMASDDDVAKALESFAGSYDTPGEESVKAATHLLNKISIAFLDHVADGLPAVAFSSGPLTGDRIGVGEPPDWVAYQTTIDVLRTHPDGPVACATLLGAGESALCAGGETHLEWYLNFAKRNRPDLPTVRGIRINDHLDCVRLVSHDAAGTSSSGSEHVKTLDVWIAHVLLLYDSLAERDTRFTYRGPGAHAARWSFKPNPDSAEKEVCFEPVYSLPASKMTLAGYTTCQHPAGDATAHGDEVVGVFKTSWQHTKNETSEGEMLDRAHEGTWLPGLARHWGHWRDEEDVPGTTVSYTEPAEPRDPNDPNKEPKEPKTTTRRKEILHLASVGQPLSQCESVGEIFEVVYDAICIIQELNKRGIMHRDLSWGNLLRHVRHDPALSELFPDKKVAGVDKVPCIRYVLTGDRDAEPCALVTDLDLSVPFAQDVSKAYKGPSDIAGTAMFMSVERDPKTRTARPRSSNDVLAALKIQLRKVEDEKELFRRAFPGRKDGFVGFLDVVFKAEMKRTGPLRPPRNYGHHPRHEVESLFWILYYALARACPRGVEPLDETDGAMSRFINAMFNSTQNPLGRAEYFAVERIKKVLHPKLARFVPLLENMVVYLSLPWDRYHKPNAKTDIELYHAYIAFKRLLLQEIRVLRKYPELDVLLDTMQPRIRNLRCDPPLPTSGRTPLPIKQAESTTAGEFTTGETSTTLLPADRDGPTRDASTIVVETAKRKRCEDDSEDEDAAPATTTKRSKDDSTPRITVATLAGMFRTDRKLWIGRGDHGALLGPKERSRTAAGFIRFPESDEDQGQPVLNDPCDNDWEEPEATSFPTVRHSMEDEGDNDWEEPEAWSRPAAAVRPPAAPSRRDGRARAYSEEA